MGVREGFQKIFVVGLHVCPNTTRGPPPWFWEMDSSLPPLPAAAILGRSATLSIQRSPGLATFEADMTIGTKGEGEFCPWQPNTNVDDAQMELYLKAHWCNEAQICNHHA